MTLILAARRPTFAVLAADRAISGLFGRIEDRICKLAWHPTLALAMGASGRSDFRDRNNDSYRVIGALDAFLGTVRSLRSFVELVEELRAGCEADFVRFAPEHPEMEIHVYIAMVPDAEDATIGSVSFSPRGHRVDRSSEYLIGIPSKEVATYFNERVTERIRFDGVNEPTVVVSEVRRTMFEGIAAAHGRLCEPPVDIVLVQRGRPPSPTTFESS